MGKHVKRIRHWAIVNLMEDVFTYAVSFQVFREMFNVTTYSVVDKGSLECSSTWYNYNLLEWIEEKATLTESRRCENVMLLPQTLWMITEVERSWCLVSAFIKQTHWNWIVVLWIYILWNNGTDSFSYVENIHTVVVLP